MKTYEIKLKAEEKEIKVHLRLTAGGLRKLKEKYDEEGMSLLMSSFQDIDRIIDIFDAALNYKNNDNEITDGEQLYDLLVDNSICGVEGFQKILTDIAINSGILTKQQGNTVQKLVKNTFEDAFADIENTKIDMHSTEEKEEKN
ncbi:MAG: hypothetical protein K2I03_08410 [Lachnospiraceae bacterium]|nr:hypothetical protein [Lachnospiraceae bacterium]